MNKLFDLLICCFHGLMSKGSCSEAPQDIMKPRAMKVTLPDEPVGYNDFHTNLQKQIKNIYDTKTSN
jgi:hypothetical protein